MTHPLITGFTLGILGGGQLGRMSALAAARLGIKVIIFCPEEDAPASEVSQQTIIAKYDDKAALAEFTNSVDVISYEFENIPLETINYIESLNKCKVLPEKKLLQYSQDRLIEKMFLNGLGIQTAKWMEISSNLEAIKASESLGINEFIIKTTRFGYDGKGQIKLSLQECKNTPLLDDFIAKHPENGFILESLVSFKDEISIIIARDIYGKTVTYGPMLNKHKNHILDETIVPSSVSQDIENQALDMAKKIADAVNLIGVLTLECFIDTNGHVIANEIAPRTHNSGHWSIDACAHSQFDQHIRTVCGLPVGNIGRHSDARMLNLIGADVDHVDQYLAQENACIHLYGKHSVREGRKMGHITFLKPKNS